MSANTRPHIVVIGSTMIDLVSTVDTIPRAGETLVGRGFAQSFGGKGANQAVMAALCGARVTFVGRVGDDQFGAQWPAHLAAFGIDTTHLRVTPGTPSGIASVWVEASGENRIVLAPGANLALTPEDAIAFGAHDNVGAVIAQFETPQDATARAFWHARDILVLTILNPAPAAPMRDDILALTDWLVPNESELRLLAAQRGITADDDIALVKAYGDATRARMVVTLGARGAAYYDAREFSEPVLIEAPKVTAVDTTGAGDAFIGAFAVALARRADAVDAIRIGIAAASDSVTRRGTTESYPRGEALRKILELTR